MPAVKLMAELSTGRFLWIYNAANEKDNGDNKAKQAQALPVVLTSIPKVVGKTIQSMPQKPRMTPKNRSREKRSKCHNNANG